VPTAKVVSTGQLGELVNKMITEPTQRPERKGRSTAEKRMDETSDPGFLASKETRLTRMVCPDCDGVLAEVELPQITYYRCHVGHEYGPQSLAAAQAESAEAKLWKAVAALEENAAFARHLASHATDGHDADLTAEHRRAAERAAILAQSIRSQLQPPDVLSADPALGE
jgi:two-component system chemotaxis response regulator CheB